MEKFKLKRWVVGGKWMNIAIVINELDVCGGTHKQVLRFAQYLLKQGHRVTIVTRCFNLDKTYSEFKDMDIRYLYKENKATDNSSLSILGKIKKRIYALKETAPLVKKIPRDCDIVNVHDKGIFLAVVILKLILKKKAKFIWQLNDLPHCFGVGVCEGVPDSVRKKIERQFFKIFAKSIDTITVNVTKNAERVKQCFGRDAKVFYCGVDVNDKLQKHSYNIKDNKVNILSSGVFFPYRNYESLIGVIENLKNKNVNVHLDVIGSTEFDKEYSEKIKNLVKEKQLENEITIWGQVDDEKYVELHNQADMFAFININQSWGLAVFEAMSCGLPVIVSESVGAIELLHNDEDAIIVDPENIEQVSDVVLKLMNDKDYYSKISENAYKVVKEFTWDKLYSERMLGLFNELTEK